ncbi:peptidase S15 [Nocardioides rotundus]|uniref:alpha/beta fold hydrolase n=1 Tax=Nocardioides rotundus TaxID=1774216 RepID=UPI001CBFD019|nr:alpha/beta fold hydrolase [Nocardioides rotundus]UAL30537.1 peptidase S15 [Nocardioides rotundus]
MKRLALSAVTAVTAALVTVPSATAPATATTGVSVTNRCLSSVPDPGSQTAVPICFTLFRPAGATADRRVPMIMHSHGWGGSRTTDPAAFDRWLSAGYGVLSFDQRGFGESGGRAYVENPRVEGQDVQRLMRYVAERGWVRKDAPGDPRMGAIGGSYGGGYQYLAAFSSIDTRGKPVLDALAPEITWFDLKESLAPQEVVRTEWALALSASSVPTDALPPTVYKALVEGSATGTWPDGSVPGTEDLDPFFARNGPKWHVRHGDRLDIPVLMGQGTTDTLFPLQQGLATWQRALTPSARQRSIFVGYNGGHVLPALLPRGVEATSDPCSRRLAGGDFEQLAVRFMDERLKGRDRDLRGYGRYHLATPSGSCTSVDSVRANSTYRLGQVASTTAAGAPLAYPVAAGPLRVAGTPYLTGDVTALGLDSRAFYGLAVGTSPADARLVQNNVLPLRERTPVQGVRRRVALPSVAVNVPRGQRLYLLVSPVSDTFAGMSSRTPGVITIDSTVLHLPRVGG